jgi:S1-C subfamily serine protease
VRRSPARRPRRIAGLLIVVVAAGCGDDGPARGTATPTVVVVAAQPCTRPTRDLGVGVVVGRDLVVTAAHVVGGRRRTVTAADRVARVVALDARTDLALLAVASAGGPVVLGVPSGPHARVLTPLGTLDVDLLRTGPLVVDDATTGRRHEREAHTFRPAVAPGTSGAPLLDGEGRLLGIVVLDNRTDGTAYAVTSAELDHFLRQRPGAVRTEGCVG